ncbi:MAG: lipopolysaccharide heptosyltransferase I [Pyrinomonadaceae bacterium]|nr:lipopolysaccharide heptosyltransferase I [Pyrinomonadaceae bacterium]
MHILFVKLSAIGDIIHALPSLAEVRRHFPEAEVSWVAESRSAELLRGNVLINNLIGIDTRSLRGGKVIEELLLDIGRQVRGLRKHKFDIAIDFQGLIKSAAVATLAGAPRRWGFARKDLREPASRFLLTDTVKIPPVTHVVRKNLVLARTALGINDIPGPIEFPIFTADEHKAEAAAITEQAGERFAILNPAGGWVTKLWNAEKFGTLADRIYEELGLTPVIAAGPSESELLERVLANSKTGKAVAVQPTLKGFYELARRAAVYVGGDTGPTHLAIAAGAPVVGIFGPTEWWRNGSTNPEDIVVERTDIGCRTDCHRRTCSNWICMDIEVETVLTEVRRRIGENG